jgi:hypothetical protein
MLPGGGHTNRNPKLLPKHRQTQNINIPVIDATTDIPAASIVVPAEIFQYQWRMGFDGRK